MTKASSIKAMNAEELQKELIELSREAFNLRMQKGTGQLSRPSQMKAVRRNIARVKTMLRQRSGGNSS